MHARDNGVQNGPGLRDTPSTHELVNFKLSEAKSLCVQLRKENPTARVARPDVFAPHPHGGASIALDFLSHAVSQTAAELLEGAGLDFTSHFTTTQLRDSCTLVRQKASLSHAKPLVKPPPFPLPRPLPRP